LKGGHFAAKIYISDREGGLALAQKLLSLRIFSYLCAEIAISARI